MADVKISALPTGVQPTGPELVPMVQSGTTIQSTFAAFVAAFKSLLGLTNYANPLLAQGGPPIGKPPSGTIGNNGALSLLVTALPTIYSGGIFLYYPFGAISTGSAAGFYWTVMSSTTAGTIYNNQYLGGTPVVPASPTPFVTTGPGAYVGDTGFPTVSASVVVPGGALGLNGELDIYALMAVAPGAGNVQPAIYYGGVAVYGMNFGSGTVAIEAFVKMTNQGNAAVQVSSGNANAAGQGLARTTINSAANQSVQFILYQSLATDYIVLEAFSVKIYPN